MGSREKTSMGGPHEWFRTTQWTQILAARTMDQGRRTAIRNALMGRYWKPVYCYLRQKGYDNDRAKDLTQGFFCEVVVGRDLMDLADPAKGRFRSFLLIALRRYVTSEYRKQTAGKRRPLGGVLALDWDGAGSDFEPAAEVTPEQAFVRQWASGLLDQVIADVEQAVRQAGQTKHWLAFRAWVLRPIAENAAPPPVEAICRELGIKSNKTAINMVITVKRRFRRTLASRIRPLVGSEADVDREIQDLIRVFSTSASGVAS